MPACPGGVPLQEGASRHSNQIGAEAFMQYFPGNQPLIRSTYQISSIGKAPPVQLWSAVVKDGWSFGHGRCPMQATELWSHWQAVLAPCADAFTYPGFQRFTEWVTG